MQDMQDRVGQDKHLLPELKNLLPLLFFRRTADARLSAWVGLQVGGQALHEEQLGLHQGTVPEPAATVYNTGSEVLVVRST